MRTSRTQGVSVALAAAAMNVRQRLIVGRASPRNHEKVSYSAKPAPNLRPVVGADRAQPPCEQRTTRVGRVDDEQGGRATHRACATALDKHAPSEQLMQLPGVMLYGAKSREVIQHGYQY